jgi:hypothetical protein
MATMGEIKKISTYDEIISQLESEGRIKKYEQTPEEIIAWFDRMTELRRDYLYKQALSEIEVSKIILTT